jgi:hypothetical protein
VFESPRGHFEEQRFTRLSQLETERITCELRANGHGTPTLRHVHYAGLDTQTERGRRLNAREAADLHESLQVCARMTGSTHLL